MPNPENLKGKGFESNPKNINRDCRPKGSRNRSTIAREMLALISKQKNPITGEEQELTHEETITLAQVEKAMKHQDTNAYKALMDSAYGAPKQEIDQKNIDVTPPRIEYYDPDGDNDPKDFDIEGA